MDFFQNLVERVDPVLSTEQDNCTIVAKVRKFSKGSIHRPNRISPKCTDYDIDNDKFRYKYPITVYANGCDSLNEGYVSIVFTGHDLYAKNVELTCVIAVVDAEENKRFLQSFTFTCDLLNAPTDAGKHWPKFIIDRYISRRTLLSEPTELLPSDTLTLHIDIDLVEHIEMLYTYDINTTFVNSSFKTEEGCPGGPRYYLFLDSLVAERLREESTYFKRILLTPMTEKSSRYMRIPDEEYLRFTEIGCILLGGTSIQLQSLEDVFDLYAVCDKYDIATVTDTCRCLLKSCLPIGYVSEISELADRYNDGCLKEMVKAFLDKETETTKSDLQLKETSVNKEWICKQFTENSKSYLSFKYQLKSSHKDKEEDAFDFYH